MTGHSTTQPQRATATMGTAALEAVSSCPVCSGGALKHRFEVAHLADDPLFAWAQKCDYMSVPVVACRKCGFLFKSRQPSPGLLETYYCGTGEDYLGRLAEDDPVHRTDYRYTLEFLLHKYPRGGRVLDVGCGGGYFLHALGETWDRHGLELSEFAASHAKNAYGLQVRTGTIFAAGFAHKFFDIVTCFDVVEHVPRPIPFLVETRRILKPGGLLILGTGDSNSWAARFGGRQWAYLAIPDHLSFFNKASLRAALSQAGYFACRFKRLHHGAMNWQVAGGWLRAVLRHWAVSCFGERVTRLPIFRQRAGALPVPYFFDHFLCMAS